MRTLPMPAAPLLDRITSGPGDRRSICRILVAVGVLAASATALSRASAGQDGRRADVDLFVDRAVEWGLVFTHFNGMSGEYYFPEMTGQGGGLVDYDSDGDVDVYLVQGALLGPGTTMNDSLFPHMEPSPPRDRLFRNDPRPGSMGEMVPYFVDVTDSARISATGYGMGVATGDIDNDGSTDLYITNVGPNQLLRNNGDGTFEDVTARAGVGDPLWGTSATLFDFDRDGWLDLYVANYVDFDLDRNPRCYAPSSRRDYCGPADFPPQADRLYRNRGDGTFEDVTLRALRGYRPGPGLGVVAGDVDGDGWQDLYVANDGAHNQLWMNRRDGTFEDAALLSGVAVNRRGIAEASMGVALGDADGDGDDDLFLTHLMGETNTLYLGDGAGLFEDRSIESGLAGGSLPYTAFGTAFLDYDNDGWLDLLVANGAVRISESLAAAGDLFPLDQPNQLYRNLGGGRFREVGRVAGGVFEIAEVSRGVAVGDVDNDGDDDVLMLNNNGPARLLINEVGQAQGWVAVRIGVTEEVDARGARLELERPVGASVWRSVRTDGSYCSARDRRAIMGLGGTGSPSAVGVHFIGGRVVEWRAPPVLRYLVVP